jgi:hypothetical protein
MQLGDNERRRPTTPKRVEYLSFVTTQPLYIAKIFVTFSS